MNADINKLQFEIANTKQYIMMESAKPYSEIIQNAMNAERERVMAMTESALVGKMANPCLTQDR